MSTKIFVNLPVADLPDSRRFFSALGYSFNNTFSDDNAACLVISDDIFVMLLVRRLFHDLHNETGCGPGDTHHGDPVPLGGKSRRCGRARGQGAGGGCRPVDAADGSRPDVRAQLH